jgi:glycogen debranching enzyme
MGAYNPMSYHIGSVWPHDNAIIATGLRRYGFVDHATRIAHALLGAAAEFGGRLPELMCGFDSSEYAQAVPYPAACSPQAWASAAPVELTRVLLGAQPCFPHRHLRVDPHLPAELQPLTVHGLRLGTAVVDLEVRDGHATVTGLPEGFTVSAEPCPCGDLGVA